jgi:ComF family protein
MHEFKYRGNRELGKQLGQLMGHSLTRTDRFTIDALLPLPLFPKKERQRGFNQASILCRGMTEILNVPILDKLITRPQFTTTQTKKGRIERWKNMEGKFKLLDPGLIMNKHVLLVDDVVTTGATLEACGQEILKAGNVRLSVMTLCYTGV